MNLEVGMYVRTNNGEIGKIRVIIDNMVFINTNQYYSNVVKASHNIIDLIEVGDYVNGTQITFVKQQDICGDEVLDYQHIYYGNFGALIEIFECDIKSIVTKEQFESMSYKVGE